MAIKIRTKPSQLPPSQTPKAWAQSSKSAAAKAKKPTAKPDDQSASTKKPKASDQSSVVDQAQKPTSDERGMTPQLIAQIKMLCHLGATDDEISQFFGVTRLALHGYRLKFPELAEAMKVGKEHADTRVERSLYSRAVGFTHRAVKIFYDQRLGEVVEHEYTEVHPPETAACIFWLKNRRPDVWRDAFVDATPPEEKARIAQEALQKLLAVEGAPVIDVQAKEVKK